MKNTKRLLCLALVLAMLSAYMIAPVSAEVATTVTDAASLQAALNAGGNVVLADYIELSAPVTVPEGVTVNLDASGYGITVTSDFVGRPVINRGTLTVIGGIIDSSNSSSGGYGAIDNYGTLTIESGCFTGSAYANGSAIRNNGTLTVNGGDFTGSRALLNVTNATITGGNFYASDILCYAIISDGILNISGYPSVQGGNGALAIRNGTANISDGIFSGNMSYALYVPSDESAGCNTSVTVTGGGFFSGGETTNAIYVGTSAQAALGSASVAISGGDVYGGVHLNSSESSISVTGGTFSKDISAFVPATHRSVMFNDGGEPAYYIFENKTFTAGQATQVTGNPTDVLRYFFTPDQTGTYSFYHEEMESRCSVFNFSAVNAATGEYVEGEYFLNGNHRGWYGSFTAGQTYCISLLVEYYDTVDMAVSCAAGTNSLQQFTIDPPTLEALIYSDQENYDILRINTTPMTTLGYPISWESSDPTVVEIDTTVVHEYGACKTNFLKAGTATITATIDNGAAGDLSATCVITVKQVHEHYASLEFVSAEPSTCQSTYLLEHYYCNECGLYFKDYLGSEETTLADLTHAPQHDLIPGEGYPGDCSNSGMAAHFYCSYCGKYYADEACTDELTNEELYPYGSHSLGYVPAASATPGMPATVEHWHCYVCGYDFADENGTVQLDNIFAPIVYEELKIGANTITIPTDFYQAEYTFTPEETGEYTLYQTYTLYQSSFGVTVTPEGAVASLPDEQWSAYTGSLYAIGNRWTLEKDVTYIFRFSGSPEMELDYELQKVVAPTAIAFSADTLRGYEGSLSNSQPYFAPIYAKPTGEITYQVGNPEVAEITEFGLLSHITTGTTTLTATVDGLTATCNVQTFASVQLTPGKENVTNNSTCDTITYLLTITRPGTYSLTAKAPEYAVIIVFDSNGNYLFGEEIGETETLTTTLDLAPGTYIIEARPMVHNTDVSILVKAEEFANPATAVAFEKAQYEIEQYLSLSLNPTGTLMTEDGFMNLIPTPTDSFAGAIQSVTISDTKVLELMKFEEAPIAYQYQLYAAAPGTATVTVTLDSGLTASCQVTVKSVPKIIPGYTEKLDLKSGANPKVYSITPKADGVYALYRTTTVNEVDMYLMDTSALEADPFMDADPLNKEGYIGGQYNLKAGKEYLAVFENYSGGDASFILYFDMLSHTHKLTKVAAKAATYTEAGNIEHYVCDACGKKFSDSTAAKEITDVTLPQLIEVVGEKAEVSEGAVDTAIKEAVAAGSTGEVKLDLTKDEVIGEESAPVSSAVLPVAALEKVAEADAKLTLTKADATVTIDTKALETISEKADGASVTLVVEQVKTEDLNTAQQAAVKDKEVAVVISAELINTVTQTPIGKEADGGFGGGTVTVQIPFTPEAGTSGEDYTIFYIADDGTATEIETTYKNGALIMELEHFSEYVVIKTGKTVDPKPTTPTEPAPTEPVKPTTPTTPSAPKPSKPSSGSNPATGDTTLLVLPMLLVLSAAMVIFFSRKKKRA